ncbi:MAG: ribosome biogenesis GTPase YlqF [Deltaproteobacteria bacterium]|nr:ribosome biogenesis GTPase YlqF [Deltaproteobacteria bacterium]
MPEKEPYKDRTVSWFPGHMHKGEKRLAQEIQSTDIVLEVRDARLPLQSGNPRIGKLIGTRSRLVLFNKSSLAHPQATRDWENYFGSTELPYLFIDADGKKALNLIFPKIRDLAAPLLDRFAKRGMRPPPVRLMIVGMPNVGKSTLINRLIRERRLPTAPTPGVTRGINWVSLKGRYLLMDSPGIMLPRIDSDKLAHMLGWIGTIRDTILGQEQMALSLLEYLLENDPRPFLAHYRLSSEEIATPSQALAAVSRSRGRLCTGGGPDLHEGAVCLLDDFRAGNLGRHTLERPFKP